MTAVLELTARPTSRQTRGNPVLVFLPLDVIEQRDGHTWIRTTAGSDLYVSEPLDQIKAAMLACMDGAIAVVRHQKAAP